MDRINHRKKQGLTTMLLLVFTAFFSTVFATNQRNAPLSPGTSFSLGGTEQSNTPTEVTITHKQSDSAVTIELKLTMLDGVYMYATEENFFKLDIAGSNIGEAEISYPPLEEIVNYDGKKVRIYRNGQIITVKIPILSEQWHIDGTLGYQACDSVQCFLPQSIPFQFPREIKKVSEVESHATKDPSSSTSLMEQISEFTTIGTNGGFLKSDTFLSFLEKPAGDEKSAFDNKSLWGIITLILFGGLALNLTPCILPMIPITLSIIGAGSQARSRKQGFLVGGVYGGAMALTYGILGVIVVLTGMQFGTLNASPAFNLAIAGIFVILSLAMFDVIHIDFTKYRNNVGQKDSSKGQLLPAFFMGVVAALLAGACVAPVVISVVLYSATLYSQGVLAGLLFPFLLGVGMALPWPFAGAGLSIIPKPGKWMIAVRNIFGIFILAMALYYGYSAIKPMMEYKKIENASEAKSDLSSKIEWHYSLEEALEESRRTNTPIVIDFWASWCKNCTAMDKTTFQDDAVAAKMNSYIPVKFQAENPNDPATKEILDHFNIVGLPSYIILEPRDLEEQALTRTTTEEEPENRYQ